MAKGAEVVAAASTGEQPRQKRIDRALVEHTDWYGAAKRSERLHHAAPEWIAKIVKRGARHQRRNREHASGELAQRGTQKERWRQGRVSAIVDKQPVHLGRRNSVRQRGGDKTARRHTDI